MSIRDMVIDHASHCDECIETDERTDIDDVGKWVLQSLHALSALEDKADYMRKQAKEA